MVNVRSGKDYKHLSEGNIPVYGTGGYMISVNQALSYDEDAIGIGRKGTIDKPYVLKAPFWTVDTLFYAVPSNNAGLNFVFDIFQNIDWKKKDESTGVPSLSKTAINEIDILVPCFEEQQVIGSYFAKIDHLITLHQRKCEACCYHLQLHLTTTWEQRKLSEFVDKAVDNRGKTPPIDENGTHPLIEVAALDGVHPDYLKIEKYLNDDSFENNLRAYIKKGDILFTTVGSIGLVSLMDSREEAAIAQNIVAFRAKEKYITEYLYALFSNEQNQYKAQRIVMGAVQPSIKVSQLVDIEYMLARNAEEQKKIGTFFTYLDHLITLHQCK